MSAYTRDVFRRALNNPAALLAPYVESIGTPVDLNTVPDLWLTLEFPQVTATRTALGYPSCMRESGVAVVHVLSRSGRTDSEAMDQAEKVRAALEGPYIEGVRMTGAQPPLLLPTDSGEWLDVTVPIGYEWDYRVQPSHNL